MKGSEQRADLLRRRAPLGRFFAAGSGRRTGIYTRVCTGISHTPRIHTYAPTHSHTHAVIELSLAPTLIMTIVYIYDGSQIVLERTHILLLNAKIPVAHKRR